MFRTIDYAFIYSYSYSTAQDRELALENGVETLGCDLLLPLADQVGRVQTQDHWSATQQWTHYDTMMSWLHELYLSLPLVYRENTVREGNVLYCTLHILVVGEAALVDGLERVVQVDFARERELVCDLRPALVPVHHVHCSTAQHTTDAQVLVWYGTNEWPAVHTSGAPSSHSTSERLSYSTFIGKRTFHAAQALRDGRAVAVNARVPGQLPAHQVPAHTTVQIMAGNLQSTVQYSTSHVVRVLTVH